jgi:urease accessory protein
MLKASSTTHDFKNPADTITLDETARHRRRMKMISDNKHGNGVIEFLLDLPQTQLLRHNEGIVLEDGRVIAVCAAPEDLFEVRGRDGKHMLALAWQIGNRHLACQITQECLIIRRDHVIREMLEGLGAVITEVCAPFDPEGGAYAKQHDHEH